VIAAEFREWRQRNGLTQAEAGEKFGVKRGAIQNWETEVNAIPAAVEMSCQILEDRLRQRRPDLGPVTLVYTDNPMFIDPYGPRRPLAMMKQEPYPTNAAAFGRVWALWGREDFHNPFILEASGKFLWNSAQLARVFSGDDADGAPLWRKVTIAKAAHEEGIAEANVNALIEACSAAYRAKKLPKDVLIYRNITDDFVFYCSPAAFTLTGKVREIADSVVLCDEPNLSGDLKKMEL